jgi:thioesterase DpgC
VRVIDRLTGSGAVGAIGNRRALRLAAEPFDTFRQYAALYAREQALCHFSPALISNLETFWNAQSRPRLERTVFDRFLPFFARK